MKRVVCFGLVAIAFASCKPDLGPGDSLVASTRVLAVKMEPAEAKPGTNVTLTALVATPDGTSATSPIAWSFCLAPKPLTVDNIVSNACLDSSSLQTIAEGPAVNATLPGNACILFGPDTPPGGFRPRDADTTGGYYQPVRGDLANADSVFELARVQCELANATPEQVSEFTKAYVPNANPHLAGLVGVIGSAPLDPAAIPAGSRVTLEASWAATDAESYAYLDPGTQAVTTKRESMRVAWYSSAGAFASESTGRGESDGATYSDDTWTAPSTPGTVHVWIVLRDSRGGVDFASYDFTVVP